MNPTNQTQRTAEEYIRIDFEWENPFDRQSIRVENTVMKGDMSHTLLGVDIDRSNKTEVSVVTEMEEVSPEEITAIESQIRTAVIGRDEVLNEDPGEADSISVSSVTVNNGTTRDNCSMSPSQPSVHFAINSSGSPEKVSAHGIEETAREKIGKRIDVQRAIGGFNLLVRDPTITVDEARSIGKYIQETEDIPYAATKTVFTAAHSDCLPDPR